MEIVINADDWMDSSHGPDKGKEEPTSATGAETLEEKLKKKRSVTEMHDVREESASKVRRNNAPTTAVDNAESQSRKRTFASRVQEKSSTVAFRIRKGAAAVSSRAGKKRRAIATSMHSKWAAYRQKAQAKARGREEGLDFLGILKPKKACAIEAATTSILVMLVVLAMIALEQYLIACLFPGVTSLTDLSDSARGSAAVVIGYFFFTTLFLVAGCAAYVVRLWLGVLLYKRAPMRLAAGLLVLALFLPLVPAAVTAGLTLFGVAASWQAQKFFNAIMSLIALVLLLLLALCLYWHLPHNVFRNDFGGEKRGQPPSYAVIYPPIVRRFPGHTYAQAQLHFPVLSDKAALIRFAAFCLFATVFPLFHALLAALLGWVVKALLVLGGLYFLGALFFDSDSK